MMAAIGSAGPVLALVFGLRKLLSNEIGGVLIGNRYSATPYPKTTLSRGEGKPLGVVYLAVSVPYAAAVLLVFWGRISS